MRGIEIVINWINIAFREIIRTSAINKIIAYGKTIVRLLETQSRKYRVPTITSFASDKSDIKKRLISIKQFKSKKTSLVLSSVLIILALSGYVLINFGTSNDTSSGSVSNPVTPKIDFSKGQNKQQLEVKGDLSIYTSSIGGLKLGDTKRDVYAAFNNMSPKILANDSQTGDNVWYYAKHDVTVYFYKPSKMFPAKGISRVVIGSNSDIATNTGIAIGDSVDKIKLQYNELNDYKEVNGLSEIWVNGSKLGSNGRYIPTLKFSIQSNHVRQIELTANNNDPGPHQKKPLSYADLKLGEIAIGASSQSLVQMLGEPSRKSVVHGIGDPAWSFSEKGITVYLDPVWSIDVISPFRGSTPRGIRIGSSMEEVMIAYPDGYDPKTETQEWVQDATDGKYQLIIWFNNGIVSEMILHRTMFQY